MTLVKPHRPSAGELVQGVFYNAQLIPDSFQYAIDAFDVLQDVHTLCVGVVAYCEWTLDGLCKLPADKTKSFDLAEL